MRTSLKEIYGKDSNLTKIKVSNLKKDYLNPNDYLAIKNLSIILRKKYTKHFIAILFFNIVIGFLFYDFIKSTPNLFNKEFLLMIITVISFLFVLFYITIQLCSTITSSYKKAQYGVVKTKFFRKVPTNNRVIKKYYANVVFKNTNTVIKNVNCSEDIYNSISEESTVLVVSFDNKTAHVISI